MIFKPGDEVEVVNRREDWSLLGHGAQYKFVVESVRPNMLPSITGAAHMQSLNMTDGTIASGYWFDTDLVGLSEAQREARLRDEECAAKKLG